MKHFHFRRTLVLALFLTNAACSAIYAPCAAPAASLTAQAFDLCMLENGTDDIADEQVESCYLKLTALPDDCESRVMIKTARCRLLAERDSPVGRLPQTLCIKSMRSEGYFVNGCEYPFTQECVERVNNLAK